MTSARHEFLTSDVQDYTGVDVAETDTDGKNCDQYSFQDVGLLITRVATSLPDCFNRGPHTDT